MLTDYFLRCSSLLVLSAALLNISVTSAGDQRLYKSEMGPHKYAVATNLDLEDKTRDKQLPLRITYPIGNEKYPIIIFSHGAMGSNKTYRPLSMYWASHGYVCIQPTHEDSLQLQLRNGKRFRLRNVWNKWNTRPPDIKLILDSLDELEKLVPALKNKLDQTRIGIGGHSFGAHTSMLIGGTKIKHPVTGRLVSYADERPKALLLISPQGTGQALVPESWKSMTRPTLIITGTRDKSPRNGKSYAWRKEVFDNAPPGSCYLLMIDGAYHGFGGIAGKTRFPGSGPDDDDHVNYVRTTSLAFWDYYLKQKPAAKPTLHTDHVANATNGAATLTWKQKSP